jgi:hypothetical protein
MKGSDIPSLDCKWLIANGGLHEDMVRMVVDGDSWRWRRRVRWDGGSDADTDICTYSNSYTRDGYNNAHTNSWANYTTHTDADVHTSTNSSIADYSAPHAQAKYRRCHLYQ